MKPAPSNPPLRIRASEFASAYNRTRQTIHKWTKTGWFNESGFLVEWDATHHLFVLVPSTFPDGEPNEDYPKFLLRKALSVYPKIESRLKQLEVRRPFPSKRERRAWLFVATAFATIIWQVTGTTGLERSGAEPTATQWKEIES